MFNTPQCPGSPLTEGLGPDVGGVEGTDPVLIIWGKLLTADARTDARWSDGDPGACESPPLSGCVFHLQVRDTLAEKKEAKDPRQAVGGTGSGRAG